MPVHDWTRVYPGTFHDFQLSWSTRLADALNSGLLPEEYYVLTERQVEPSVWHSLPMTDEATTYRLSRRTLTIRHSTSRQIVAMIEILSPSNKDRQQSIEQFVDKAVAALRQGINLLIVDVHAPRTGDFQGILGEIWLKVDGGAFEFARR